MTRIRPEGPTELWLDHCPRCGGIWFDEGEVEQLRAAHPRAIATKVKISENAYRMQCHSCHASMARNLGKCTACGWKNVIDCPRCEKPLAPVRHDALKIDVCKSCHGAWFDNSELAEIWNRSVTKVAAEQGRENVPERFFGDYFLIDSLFWHSALHSHGGTGGGATDVASAGAAEAIAPDVSIGDAAGSVVSGIGDAAGNVVDNVGDVAGGLFSSVADFFSGINFGGGDSGGDSGGGFDSGGFDSGDFGGGDFGGGDFGGADFGGGSD
jgi:Zn-finger nucleic acid-binding protein